MSDKDILDTEIGGVLVRNMTALTFLQYIARKLNGAPAYKAGTQELLAVVSHAPLSNAMSDDEKVRLVKQMERAEIPFP